MRTAAFLLKCSIGLSAYCVFTGCAVQYAPGQEPARLRLSESDFYEPCPRGTVEKNNECITIYDSAGYDVDGYNREGRDAKGNRYEVLVIFKTTVFIKNLKVDGFTVDWPTGTVRKWVASGAFQYDVPESYCRYKKVPVGTELIVEYTTYAMNGFGHHRNESNKRRRIPIVYKTGVSSQFVSLK